MKISSKIVIASLVVSSTFTGLLAQNSTQDKEEKTIEIYALPNDEEDDENSPYRKPLFPGGKEEMMKYIQKNLNLPKDDEDSKKSGNVIVRFIINAKGEVTKPEILKGLSPVINKEMLRVITSMPAWRPGKSGGKISDMYYYTIHVPVNVKKDEPEPQIAIMTVTGDEDRDIKVASNNTADEPLYAVDQMPEFPGGVQNLMKFIGDNVKYPSAAVSEGVQGRVIIRFVVDTDGSVNDATVMRSVHPACDEEALRVINSMPKWTPGQKDGKNVAVYFTLPIVYKLPNNSNEEDPTPAKNILYVLDGKVVNMEALSNMKNTDVEEIKVIEDKEEIEKTYGNIAQGKDKVIIITRKKE